MLEKLMTLYWKIFPLRIMRYHLFRIEEFVKYVSKNICIDGKILDVGAQNSPYKNYFSHIGYFSQDYVQNSSNSIDYVGDINNGLDIIPNGSFDYILCTQVLEHIKRPEIAFKEFNRILKPGGKLFLTTHQSFEEHMIPYDYYRFTKYGLSYLGESSGFHLSHVKPHGGIFQILALIIDTIPIKLFFKRDGVLYYIYIILFTLPIFFFNLICYLLDFLDKEKIMTLNYECIYEKIK